MEYIKRIENIDKIKELKSKLRRKKDVNSSEVSEQIAQLFYNLIQDSFKNEGIKTHSQLILLMKYFCKKFSAVDPVQFCIANTIKKILHIIREEIKESEKEKNNTQNNPESIINKIKDILQTMSLSHMVRDFKSPGSSTLKVLIVPFCRQLLSQ